PNVSVRNFSPSSTALASPEFGVPGVTFVPQMEQGHATLTVTPADGVSRFPLSSAARVRIVAVGLPCTTQLYDQLVVPVAGCQLVPPSVEISTPATTPPPVSAAVPVTVTRAPSARFAFGAGEVMVEDGAAVSVLAVAGTRPGISANGCACMSANR